MARESILSVPGKIYPGFSEELTNQPMTQYNDLRNVMAVRPEIIDAVSILHAEQSGKISEILAYMDGYYSPSRAALGRRMGQGARYNAIEKNIKLIGNHEYAWRLKTPKGRLYKFTRNAEGMEGIDLGANGTEFYVWLNRLPIEQDDVIELADGNTHLLIVTPPQFGGKDWKCRVRLNYEFTGQIVDSYLVSKDMECNIVYNLKPEASEHGSKISMSFGAWMKNYMTTMRWEWNITGLAAHSKTDVQWLVYTDPISSKMEPYWIPALDYQMMMKADEHVNNFLWNGKKAVNADGTFLPDRRGRLYYSGDGAYTQCSKKLRIGYNDLTIEHLDEMMKNVKLDSLEIEGTPELVLLPGLEFRLKFDKLMRNEFKLSPEVFYVAGDAGNGLKSNFRFYETPLGRIYCLDGNFFDSKANATLYDDFGNRLQSYRAVLVNVSKHIGGTQNMFLVSRAGRQNVIGEVKGMSNPGPDNVLTTTADVQGKHLLREIGIAVTNPYCMGEFYKPFKNYREAPIPEIS